MLLFFGCSSKELGLLTREQNTTSLVQNLADLDVSMDAFNSRYFMPWSLRAMPISEQIATWANRSYGRVNTYYAENLLLWSEPEIQSIIENTNFNAFDTIQKYAITTQNTQIRNLPTKKPFFRKTSLPGEGFPFDYMQNTRLHVNTPLFISHLSKDGAWAFAQSPQSSGWIEANAFTFIDAHQRNMYQQSEKILITKDNLALYTKKQNYLTHVKLGAIFAKDSEDDSFFYSYMYLHLPNLEGQKIAVRIAKKDAKSMPLPFNTPNVLQISTELLGEKYGWGGYLGNRDCSAMTQEFLRSFGLWVPRNSAAQKNAGEYISLEGLGNKEKEEMILKNGIAFLSLIYLQGHIMLYAGEENGRAMVMHNLWGVRTIVGQNQGRAIIGKAVISDLYLGANQSNVAKESLLIARVKGLVIAPNSEPIKKSPLSAYPSIKEIKDNIVTFEDNSTLPFDDGIAKDFEQKIANASIKDMLSSPYPAFEPIIAPPKDSDPGRYRPEAFFAKLYGEDAQSVKKNLVKITWLPNISHETLYFNKQQNAARALQKVSNELEKLPKKFHPYITNIGGTFAHRNISGTQRLSPHAFGIAIDINVGSSAYWKWDKIYRYRNSIPKEIVDIFEKYGFIWGGRWYHYDTMHFEYRPEMFESID